jgi:pimeloyl-ACP methyl ester carboxylesterase
MVDLPGHGKTFPINWKPIYEKKDYVQFVKNFLEAVDINNFALSGDAIGARISLMYGATVDDKRLKGLILFEPAEYIPGDWYGPMGSLESDLPDSLSISRWFLKLCSSRTPREAASKVSWLPLSNAYQIGLADLYQASLDIRERLSKIDYFVSLIRGVDDPLVSMKDLQEMKKKFKNAEVREIELAGHFAPVENPKGSAEAIADSLKKIF